MVGHRFLLMMVTLGIFLGFIGCERGPKGVVRDKVSKVTGTLLIDGEPESMVAVRLIRVNGPDPEAGTSQVIVPSAYTDDEGKFTIGTYEGGPNADGAPKGDYAVVFQWGQINLIGGNYAGDKFKGKYSDPEKSEIKLTVADAPVDLGEIQLSTK
ncbi:hypothetical protein [Schlesneria sp. T3-172]|uniref:hypothetical protein n=1 Tax=Schlesneria TaxID=656899 RepID=UPI002F1DEF84